MLGDAPPSFFPFYIYPINFWDGQYIPILKKMIWTFISSLEQLLGFPGGSVVKNLPAKQKMQVRSLDQEDAMWYSCLGNPMDRGAWRATVHRVAKSQTQLSNWARMNRRHVFIYLFFEEQNIDPLWVKELCKIIKSMLSKNAALCTNRTSDFQ